MRKVSLLILFSLLTVSLMAAAPLKFEKSWERGALVDTTEDNVRNIAVSPTGDMLATINIYAEPDAIKLYNATSGQPNVAQESLDMGPIAPGKYNICSGGFSEDGAFFACNLDAPPWVAKDLTVYYWDDLSTGPKVIYTRASQAYRVGDAFDVIGRVDDNSVSVLIAGNGADSYPVRLTTADNGATWTPEILGNFVKATDVEQITGGAFFGTSAGANIVKYNADGTVAQDLAVGEALSCVAVDEALNLVYGMSGPKSGFPYLLSFDAATGAAVDNFSADPIDQGPATYDGYWNGSSDIEIDVTAGGATRIFAVSEREGVARYSYGSEVTVPGDYASVSAAVAALGSELSTATAPLIISCDPANVIDEALDLRNYPMDLIIKSADPAQKVVFKIQIVTDDGICIGDSENGTCFKNIVFTPSQTNPVTDDLIKYDETNGANTDMNWLEFIGCVITDCKADGDPMIMSKAEAYDAPPASGSSLVGSGQGDCLFKMWNDSGESVNLFIDDTVFYAAPWLDYFITDGNAGEQVYMNNAWFCHAAIYGLYMAPRGGSGADYFSITGDDAGAGPESASFFYGNGDNGIDTTYANQDSVLKVSNTIIDSATRCINSGGYTDLQIKDSILSAVSYVVRDGITNYPEYPATWERCTFHRPAGVSLFYNANAGNGNPITATDCVFYSAPFGGVDMTFNNCVFTTNTADASTEVNSVVLEDLDFISLDAKSASYFDVTAPELAAAASDGGALSGGADYVYMFEYVGGEYANGDTNLVKKISNADLIEGKTLAVTAGGWYVLSGNQEGVSLTNGIYDAGSVADLYRDNVTSPVFEAIVLEYDFVTNDSKIAQIDEIVIFAGHDGDGSRAFINCDVAVDTGSGYAALGTIMTGAYGKTQEAAASAWAKWFGSQSNVEKIQFTFYDVSHNSTGYFQKYDDNSAPANNFPNQGAIIKEIDIIGSVTDAPSGVDDWMLF